MSVVTRAASKLKFQTGDTPTQADFEDLHDSIPSFGVKSYVALLTQSGTDAPVATVLENTLGGTVVWTRDSAGVYIGTLASAFTENKTYITGMIDWASATTFIPISDGAGIIGYYTLDRLDVNSIRIQIFNNSFASVDLGSLIGSSIFYLPKIEVYP